MIRISLLTKKTQMINIIEQEIKQMLVKYSFDNVITTKMLPPQNNCYDFYFIEINNEIELNQALLLKTTTNINLIFISSDDKLVHKSLIAQPLYFIRTNHFNNDLKTALKQLTSYIEKHCFILCITNKGVNITLNVNSIIYIESFSHYIFIHTTVGDYESRNSISQIAKKVQEYDLIRIHKSYIVNKKMVKARYHNKIVLVNNQELPIGRSYKNVI